MRIGRTPDYRITVWQFAPNGGAPILVYSGPRTGFDFDTIRPDMVAVDDSGRKILR